MVGTVKVRMRCSAGVLAAANTYLYRGNRKREASGTGFVVTCRHGPSKNGLERWKPADSLAKVESVGSAAVR